MFHPFVAYVRSIRSGSSVLLDVLCVSSDRKYPHPVDQDELSRCDVSFQRCLDNVERHSFCDIKRLCVCTAHPS